MNKKQWLLGGSLCAIAVLVLGGIYGFLYLSSPEHIRYPKVEHYHFRTQIVVAGQSVDFSTDQYQQDYDKGSCSAELSKTPIDFHDNLDQMTHIHWDGMTGGEFLKYFGWNFIGGLDDTLGRRYDDGLMNIQSVKRHGDLLPAIPDGSNYYLYIGGQDSYEQKSWEDFLDQDLEDFFGQKSNLSQDQQASLFERIFNSKAYAHGSVDDGHEQDTDKTEEELQRINNLVGNLVIFVSEDQPTKEQIEERFDNLVPLQDSTCGG